MNSKLPWGPSFSWMGCREKENLELPLLRLGIRISCRRESLVLMIATRYGGLLVVYVYVYVFVCVCVCVFI